jgi:Arc/MetJ-type ribon-helix-helix transcriptional regulator
VKTLTVRLPDALVADIEQESQARRVSKSDVVRERLHQTRRSPVSGGRMGDLIGDVLETSWAAKVPAGLPRFRSLKKQKLAERIRAKKLHR